MSEKFRSLAETLGAVDPRPEADRPLDAFEALGDVADPKEFCARIVASREFRQYIMNGIVLGDLPPAVMCRVIDYAWGKPPERVEHTGKDGAPIETVTEVRRVVVRRVEHVEYDTDEPVTYTRH